MYLPHRTPRLRVCQVNPKIIPTNPLKSGRSLCCPASTSSSRAARPQSPFLLQNANVNLVAKLPMSILSPKCTTHEPLTASPSHCPRAGLNQKCPTLGRLRPLYLLGFDSHSALPISARNTSIGPYLARSATHRPHASFNLWLA